MNLETIDIALIFVYFAVLLFVGWKSSRKQKNDDYLIAERKLGPWSTMATINASKTGSILMIFVAMVYTWGISAIWYFIGMSAGMLLFIPFAIRLKKYSNHKYYTLGDYFKARYGKFAGGLASLISAIIMFGFLVLNLVAGTKIFTFFTGWPFWICAVIMVIVVTAYILMGGFKAVVKTDFIQYIAMVGIMILLMIVLFGNITTVPVAEWNLLRADTVTLVGFFLLGIFFPFGMPELWQRVYASKDEKSLKKGFLWSIAIYVVVALLLGIIAVIVKSKFPSADPDLALIFGFQQLLPAGLLGLSVVLMFAAIMSSIDTYIFTCSSTVVQGFMRYKKKAAVSMMKKTILVLALLGTILAIIIQDLLIAGYIFATFFIVLGVAAVATWINKKIRSSTLSTGLIFGFGGTIIFIILGISKGEIQPTVVIVGLLSTLVGIGIGWIVGIIRKLISK
jgi:solute:Na+ symporter, SSS family